ncbi:MAG: hypothetical protein ACHQU8_08390 [Gemmatimonadales bacterium]
MAIPWPVLASVLSELGPLGAAAARPAQTTGGRRWVVIWCGLYVAQNAVSIPLALTHHNNHWTTYVFVPLQGAAILWALSLWQLSQLARLTVRASIPGFVLAWLLLVLLVEDTNNFSSIAEPVYSLLSLSAALYTLVTRSADATESLLREDWFWICAGLSLHFGALIFLTPLGAALVRTNPEIILRALNVRAVVNVAAFVLITCGLLCPRPSLRSGRSFSPASSA